MSPLRLCAVPAVVLCLVLMGCGAATDEPTTASSGATAAARASPSGSSGPWTPIAAGSAGRHDIDGRGFEIAVPASYDVATPAPLIMLLHGYGSDGAEADSYAGLRTPADERGALYVVPEGTADSGDRKFWNATEACCDFSRSGVDDTSYLASVLRSVADTYAVDPARVIVVGHSNGGFMAYRLACDHPDLVSHAVSISGAMPIDESACAPSAPASVLQVHGTADPTIRYDGGTNGPFAYPSALASVQAWARLNGCDSVPEQTPGAFDLDTGRPGAETSVTRFPACDEGARVELWSIDGAGHVPALGDEFPDLLLDYVLGGP